LTIRRSLARKTIWIDHKRIKLPYHGDGDLQELQYYLYGDVWWKAELSALRPYVHEGDVAIDVGANLGFMSGILGTLTGPNGRVFSFEPSPSTYPKLLEVLSVNGFTNVTAYNIGCGTEEQAVTLYYPPSSGHATIRPDEQITNCSREQVIRIVKLDDFLGPLLNRLDLIKIDTEGYEDEVLLGAVQLLRRFKPVIYIELCSQYLASSERAIMTLHELGYSFRREPDLTQAVNGDNFFVLPTV
jgi:FkbM family methyltransferase